MAQGARRRTRKEIPALRDYAGGVIFVVGSGDQAACKYGGRPEGIVNWIMDSLRFSVGIGKRTCNKREALHYSLAEWDRGWVLLILDMFCSAFYSSILYMLLVFLPVSLGISVRIE